MTHIPDMLKSGQRYINTWPMRKELYTLFPECRIIAATQLAMKVMPMLAVIIVAVQLNILGIDYLPQSLAFGIFFISLPIQGLLWLGHRAEQPLPPSIKAWYLDIYAKMQQQGCSLQAVKSTPKYKELAVLLKTAFSELDKAFTERWF